MAGAARAEIVSVGSELLAGETVDTNAAFLAGELTRLGFEVAGARQVPDQLVTITHAFDDARRRSAFVAVTGGLGPTHDDLSREALAAALGEEPALDPALEADLRARFAAYGRMPPSNLKQAMLIPSAEVLSNPIGSAPGWWVDRDGSVVVLLPGVPSEMRRMWAERVRPRLGARFDVREPHVRVVKAFGIGESAVAERLGALLSDVPAGVSAGIYARDDGIHVRYVTRVRPEAADALAEAALEALGVDAYGTDGADLARIALSALTGRGVRTLSTHEAGTDGALAALLVAAAPAGMAVRCLVTNESVPGDPAPPGGTALLVRLLGQDARGRSEVEVSLDGSVALGWRRVRVHGSGAQRLRRAAFAALDLVRRELG